MACMKHLATARFLSTTARRPLDQRWRAARGLPPNPTARGALTDAPDYTYLDGRLTPAGVGQRERLETRRRDVERIVALTEEVDSAKLRWAALGEAERERRHATLAAKLEGRRDDGGGT